MGLSSLAAPSESVLRLFLVNTALSISIFKGILHAILRIVGIRLSFLSSSTPSSDYTEDLSDPIEYRSPQSETYINEFRSRTPTTRFDSVSNSKQLEHHDCSVCLTQFEPESEINCLSCGHLFHKVCLEKWLNYWNVTCPLCRSSVMPSEDDMFSCY
ncbi:probable E3 ubiquitin-protein ligase XERICO [Mercurialis annua]|uniref:probable E3 ubiquitin-protein ligase XERICO n=1 Tax=Mercurialis annua TaxID=3986 RepID=UPI00215EF431|nr:probable E3 ubiquitin-protein ligase XERICO [Mercurialis annua]